MLFAQQNRPPHQLKVVVAKESLADDIDVKELDIPYDWTYTTEYQGSIEQYKSQGEGIEWINCSVDSPCVVKSTDEKIDFEKLKEREPILWFDEVTLFEDELHDNGVSRMTIKTRVMDSGFYCLAQFWMRLDHVAIRLYETRMHHLFGKPYVLREFTKKEANFSELFAAGRPKSMAMYTDVRAVQEFLTTTKIQRDKIELNSQ